ncbi:39S ribosomal protein L2, mitochondrial [Nilaparvata lugens]|uniref:39S ribosomal protein L2, mitochondrial n=1 Tax=Nilaparvata lugens TaxID=108931 RepID=UPI00193D0714|nr:39S ribosomal protein L2, mitochondrial [Nilaparvata lugens]
MALACISKRLSSNLVVNGVLKSTGCQLTLVNSNYSYVRERPKPDGQYRRKVHYPEKYTVRPLDVTRLAGRDPETGYVVVKGLGGGLKYKFHWIDSKRVGPKDDSPPLIEKVMLIQDVFERTAKIALVASGDRMKWIIATENMQPGDLIKTSMFIPKNPIMANEGDAYPLGALPIGTVVSNIERYPGLGGFYCHSAGTAAVIKRTIGKRVVIKLPSKAEVALPRENMATIGRVSNIEHGKTPLGTPQANRELGIRPCSGLFQKKDGRFGRKIKPPKPAKIISMEKVPRLETLSLTMYFDKRKPWHV